MPQSIACAPRRSEPPRHREQAAPVAARCPAPQAPRAPGEPVALSEEQRRVILDLGREALRENADWVPLRRQHPARIPK